MRISLNTAISKINFQSKVKTFNSKLTDDMNAENDEQKKAKLKQEIDDLKEKIDVFEETHGNAKELGSGLFATAYLLNGTNYVIKESLDNDYAKAQNGKFYQEAEALSMIPKEMSNTQKFIARAETEKNKYYLISTFVEGKPAKFGVHNWDKSAFESLFATMEHLDEAGIFHNDLNEANCLFGEHIPTSIIDYQFAEKFSASDNDNNKKEFKTPYFMMPANAQMFEMASLPFYIMEMKGKATKKEIRELFKIYIKAKSTYAHNRKEYLKDSEKEYPTKKDKIEYERLQEKFYKNPSDDMIDLQAKKMQLLYSFRKTFSILDKNVKNDKNMFLAIPYYLYTAACAKNMIDKAEEMKQNTKDDDLKEFLSYEKAFGYFWKEEMLKELNISIISDNDGVWPWITRNAKLSPKQITKSTTYFDSYEEVYHTTSYRYVSDGEDISNKLKISGDLPLGKIYNVSNLICNDNNTGNTKNPFKDGLFDEEIKNLTEIISNTRIMPKEENKSKLINYLVLREKYIDGCKKTIAALKEKRLNAAVTNAVKAEFYRNIARKNFSPINLSPDEEFKYEQFRLLSINKLIPIAKSAAEEIIKCINNIDPQPDLLKSLENLD